MANAYVMRTNMSVAIVAMVNHTFVEAGNEEAVDDECPEYENITSSVSYLTAYHYWFQIPKLSCWTISYATKCKLCMETECIGGVGGEWEHRNMNTTFQKSIDTNMFSDYISIWLCSRWTNSHRQIKNRFILKPIGNFVRNEWLFFVSLCSLFFISLSVCGSARSSLKQNQCAYNRNGTITCSA